LPPTPGLAACARAADNTDVDGLYALLQGVGPARTHGEGFTYRSVNTDVLAWVLQRASGERIETLLSRRLWSGLGVERDAYITCDPHGMPFAAGGLCTTVRPARMGEMRCEGAFNGRQLVPAAAVAAIRAGGDRRFARAGYALLRLSYCHSGGTAECGRHVHGLR
jgi:hypothetical protein